MKTVKRGDTGADVLALQAVLNSQGITGAAYGKPLEIDGEFGADTQTAVKKAQQRANAYGWSLEVDGICGPKTWATLITERT